MNISFYFVNSNENNLIYFLLTNGKGEQWIVSELFIRASCSRFRSFVTKSKDQSNVERRSVKKGEMAWLTDMYFQL